MLAPQKLWCVFKPCQLQEGHTAPLAPLATQRLPTHPARAPRPPDRKVAPRDLCGCLSRKSREFHGTAATLLIQCKTHKPLILLMLLLQPAKERQSADGNGHAWLPCSHTQKHAKCSIPQAVRTKVSTGALARRSPSGLIASPTQIVPHTLANSLAHPGCKRWACTHRESLGDRNGGGGMSARSAA